MPPSRVRVTSAPIPFRTTFKHASASRKTAENVIVTVQGPDGLVGVGEGCPREYVTGETVESARAFLDRWADQVAAEVGTVQDVVDWLSTERNAVDANPSAACALELALLDLLGQRAGVPVEKLLGLTPLEQSPEATAVYGDGSVLKFAVQFAAFGWNRIRPAKLKLSGEPAQDLSRAKRLARRGPLRLDVNNLWPDARSAANGLKPLTPYAWAVEEPVRPRDWSAMLDVHRATGLAVILDESFLTATDLSDAEGDIHVANVRVSKHGGLIRTLEAIDAAQRRGLRIVVGAQVGETSILARAGLVALSAAGPSPVGYEGGYGRHLLSSDLCAPSLTFGRGGRFSQELIERLALPGLGLTVEAGAGLA